MSGSWTAGGLNDSLAELWRVLVSESKVRRPDGERWSILDISTLDTSTAIAALVPSIPMPLPNSPPILPIWNGLLPIFVSPIAGDATIVSALESNRA